MDRGVIVNLTLLVVWLYVIYVYGKLTYKYIYKDDRDAQDILKDKDSDYNKYAHVILSVGTILGILTNVMYLRYFSPYLLKKDYLKIINVIIFFVSLLLVIISLKIVRGDNIFSRIQLSILPLNGNLIMLTVQTLNNILTMIAPTSEDSLLGAINAFKIDPSKLNGFINFIREKPKPS